MLTSVFTPTHNPRWLDEAYEGLRDQTVSEWGWIVLLNGGAPDWAPPQPDERVRVMRVGAVSGVGAAKRIACEHARGEVLLELDHDDVSSRTASVRSYRFSRTIPRSRSSTATS